MIDTFGEKLRFERIGKGYSQKEFAEEIGVTPSCLNYWEKDKREPNLHFIKKISDILECSVDYLLNTNYYTNHNNFEDG